MAQITAVTSLGFFIQDSVLIVKLSILQASCCISLSLYSCTVKKEFTRLWSHVFFMLILVLTTATLLGINLKNYLIILFFSVGVALWFSLVTHNAIELIKTTEADEGFYGALMVQTDFTLLTKRCWDNKRRNSNL